MAERPDSPRPKSPTEKAIRTMEEELTQHHLKYLLEDTIDAQTKWKFIGLYLGLPPPTLTAIGKNVDSSDEQYTEVLYKWLQSGVTPTMRKLIEALESNTVKENNLAVRLRSKYAKKTTAVQKDLAMESSVDRQELPAEVFTKTNITMIQEEFGWLVTQTAEKLQQAQVTIKKLCLFFTTSFFSSLKEKETDHVPAAAIVSELEKAADFYSFFQILTMHGVWSYDNYRFLESIIKKLVPDLRNDMKEYLEHYKGFRLAAKLEDYIAALDTIPTPESPDPEIFSRMKTKLQVDPSEKMLKYIDDLWEALSIHLNLPPYQLLLEKVQPGSITIIWCFPRYETMRITEMVKSSFQFFSKHDIVEVSINGEIVYQAKMDSDLETVAAGSVGDQSQVTSSSSLVEAVEPSSTVVSKSYIRLKLAHDDLLQDYLSVGEQTFLKSKEADITRLKQVDMMQLISASASGDRKQVQLLLGMGADVNTRNTYGQTAVYSASALGHSEVVKLLVQAGADLELQHKESQDTALTISSAIGHSEVVRVLLEAGANINHQDKWGQTAVYNASDEGHSEVVKLLVQAGADLELQHKNGQTAVFCASTEGHSEVVKLLVQAGADLELQHKDQLTALMVAARNGHTAVVKELLTRQDLNINMTDEWGQTAVFCASAEGHSEVVKLLVQAGADLELHTEEDQTTPLTISSDRGHSEVVRVLLEAGANVNQQAIHQLTPLMEAAMGGHTAVVKELLTRQDLNINMTDKNGRTAMDLALMIEHFEITLLILSKLYVDGLQRIGH